MNLKIELVFFGGCPHVGATREALRAALDAVGRPGSWQEWDLEDAQTPVTLRGFPSPTVLVNGMDVSGPTGDSQALSCRSSGAPSVAQLTAALVE